MRENFRQIFMSLFGGGECDLRLENPDAPLDCDIEIHASPRGKRTQRIHLLSSGERALVALSLLFGIFLTKPSPFCLLDEVDAPLDDANVGRFVRMLTQFKSRTQFIVITHNPRTTTEAADAVYGVTMQEPGVSSLVSVRMRGAPVGRRGVGGTGRRQRGPNGGMSRWRRVAAWLGVVARWSALIRLGAQNRPESIALAISSLKSDSSPPAPNILVTGLRSAARADVHDHARAVDGARIRQAVLHSVGRRVERHVSRRLAAHAVCADLFSGAPDRPVRRHRGGGPADASDSGVAEARLAAATDPRRPQHAESALRRGLVPGHHRGLWQYDLTIVNTPTAHGAIISPLISDTSFVLPDSLEANASYSWQVTARAVPSTGCTEVTVTSAGTFAITSAAQPTFTLLYQNFPDPFGRGQRSDQTCFWFDLDRAATVRLTIFDIRLAPGATASFPARSATASCASASYGRQDIDLLSGCDPRLTWDGTDDNGRFVPPGVYIAQFVANGKSARRKILYKGSLTVRFTTLGTGTISLSPGRSCAGYFLEAPELRLLIDCGSGITRRLAEFGLEWQTITHVALTHFHIDHHGDLPTLIFAWKYGFLPPRSAPGRDHWPGRHGGAPRAAGRGVRRVGHRARFPADDPRDHADATPSSCQEARVFAAIRFPTPPRAWHIPWSAAAGESSTPATPDRPASWPRGRVGAICSSASARFRRRWAFRST